MARTRKQKSAEHAEGLARKIWLAGLGAYGKSVGDAQGQLDKASQEASKLFNELVDKGQEIEDQSRDAIRRSIAEARNRISERASANARPVEDMIQRVRERMSRESDALAEMVGRLAGRRTPAAPAAGATTKSKPKPTANKAARKPATRRGATARKSPRR